MRISGYLSTHTLPPPRPPPGLTTFTVEGGSGLDAIMELPLVELGAGEGADGGVHGGGPPAGPEAVLNNDHPRPTQPGPEIDMKCGRVLTTLLWIRRGRGV